MPHLVLLYSSDLEQETDFAQLTRALADTMLAQRDEADKPVFPTGGTRVLAFPAAYAAIADGKGDYGFLYAHLRMGAGRSSAVHQATGEALKTVLHQHFSAALECRPIGITLQIDEGKNQVFDGKLSSLHPLFR